MTGSSKNGTLCNDSTFEIITFKDYGSLRTCKICIAMAAVLLRCAKAAENFRKGRARHPYAIRRDIIHGTAPNEIGEKVSTDICIECRTLLDLKPLFDTFVHSGRALSRHRAVYTKPTGTDYYDLTKQNNFLIKSVFDGKGNYLYHRDCIRLVFGVSNQ